MSRQTLPNGLIISAASSVLAATAYSAEPAGQIDRAAFQTELAPLSADTRAQAADVGRAVADRALAVTHCVTRLATGTVMKALRGGD
ncbi:MAG: hypothetical protein OEQ25_00195 [Gammaproteobacteria bacterium]|nr:hypothetical protein [Gammaproteobacteria bacterium]MDH3505531.1 hypothetical protein [Gammaproteobacteria bacterium]